MAKYIVEILNKISDDSVKLFVKDNRYCSIINDNNSFGIWFEMAAYRQSDGKVLDKYKNNPDGSERSYTDLRILLDKESVLNAIKNLKIGGNKSEKSDVIVDFNDEEAHNTVSDFDEPIRKEEPENKNDEEDKDETSFSGEDTTEDDNIEVENKEVPPREVNVESDNVQIALIFGDIKKNNVIKLFTTAKVKDKVSDLSNKTFVMNYQVWEQILSVCDGSYVILGIYHVDDKTNYFKFDDIVVTEEGNKLNGVMYTVASNS